MVQVLSKKQPDRRRRTNQAQSEVQESSPPQGNGTAVRIPNQDLSWEEEIAQGLVARLARLRQTAGKEITDLSESISNHLTRIGEISETIRASSAPLSAQTSAALEQERIARLHQTRDLQKQRDILRDALKKSGRDMSLSGAALQRGKFTLVKLLAERIARHFDKLSPALERKLLLEEMYIQGLHRKQLGQGSIVADPRSPPNIADRGTRLLDKLTRGLEALGEAYTSGPLAEFFKEWRDPTKFLIIADAPFPKGEVPEEANFRLRIRRLGLTEALPEIWIVSERVIEDPWLGCDTAGSRGCVRSLTAGVHSTSWANTQSLDPLTVEAAIAILPMNARMGLEWWYRFRHEVKAHAIERRGELRAFQTDPRFPGFEAAMARILSSSYGPSTYIEALMDGFAGIYYDQTGGDEVLHPHLRRWLFPGTTGRKVGDRLLSTIAELKSRSKPDLERDRIWSWMTESTSEKREAIFRTEVERYFVRRELIAEFDRKGDTGLHGPTYLELETFRHDYLGAGIASKERGLKAARRFFDALLRSP